MLLDFVMYFIVKINININLHVYTRDMIQLAWQQVQVHCQIVSNLKKQTKSATGSTIFYFQVICQSSRLYTCTFWFIHNIVTKDVDMKIVTINLIIQMAAKTTVPQRLILAKYMYQ